MPNFPANKDIWLLRPIGGSANFGNGQGPTLVVGRTPGASGGDPDLQSRVVFAIPYDMTQDGLAAYGVDDGQFWFYSVNAACATRGGSVAFLIEELTGITSIVEGTEDRSCGYSSNGSGEVWPGPGTASTTNRGAYNPGGDPGTGWKHASLKAMMAAKLAAGKTKGTLFLRLIAGTTGGGYDEQAASRTILIRSKQAAGDYTPYLHLDLNFNHPPDAPTVTTARTQSGGAPAIMPSSSGRTVQVDWAQNDQDAGDYTAKRQHLVYADSATDGAPGTPILDVTLAAASGTTPTSGSDTLGRGLVSGTAPASGAPPPTVDYGAPLPIRTPLRHCMRTYDGIAWGAKTSLADGRFQTAYTPNAPVNPYFQNTIPSSGTVQPLIAGSISSADPGDYVTQYEPEVLMDQVGGGTITMWAPGAITIYSGPGPGPTRAQVSYGGVQLNPGDKVRWRHRIYGRDGAVGAWSPYMQVTIVAVTGPTGMSPTDRNTKILSPLGPLVVADAANFDRYQVVLKRNGATVWDSGIVTVASTLTTNVAIPAGILNFGDGAVTGLTWNAAIRHTGNSALDPASPDYPIQVDTLPSTATAVSA